MKKIKLALLTILSVFGSLFGLKTLAASSTVLLDPPDITNAVASIYNTAQPLFNSLGPWLWFFVGIAIVFVIIKLLVGIFNR